MAGTHATGRAELPSPTFTADRGAEPLKHSLAVLVLAVVGSLAVPDDGISSPWSRVPKTPDKSQGAVVAQVLGANTWVEISYHRPGLRGRPVWTASNSRGQRFVPHDGDPTPWRAGANECTTFEVSTDIQVEGQDLPAGKYGLFIIPRDGLWTVIFNSDHEQWGSRGFDESKDVLRVDVEPQSAPMNEWLQFGFDHAEASSTQACLSWGEVKLPFTLSLPPEQG